jgi:hypothetical protein
VRLVCVLALVLTACGYAAPTYTGTAFKCDGTHPCPTGQSCVDGVCTGSDSGSGVGPGAPVVCVGVTCASGDGCCYDPVLGQGNHCAAPGSCNGNLAACTSAANCGSGERCCNSTMSPMCGPATCPDVVCTTGSDCPADKPVCCPLGDIPWRYCSVAC